MRSIPLSSDWHPVVGRIGLPDYCPIFREENECYEPIRAVFREVDVHGTEIAEVDVIKLPQVVSESEKESKDLR